MRQKELLFALEARCTAIVASGVINFVPKRIVMNRIGREIGDSNDYLKKRMMVMYDKLLPPARVNKKKRADFVYSRAKKEFQEMEKLKNKLANRAKIEDLEEKLAEDGIFFLCSSFSDCAEDHKDYQGRIYVAEDWQNRTSDARVARYIAKHQIQTVEDVCFGPPYLITRPNCRHTMIPMSVNNVISGSWRDEVYEIDRKPRNYTYVRYYERLKFLSEMSKRIQIPAILDDVVRTRRLMAKWKNRANYKR